MKTLTPHKHADILRAIADGHEVQTRGYNMQHWMDCMPYHVFNYPDWEYRIKLEPKRKTLGEVCKAGFTTNNDEKCWDNAAKAVAEAIIERHLSYNLTYETDVVTAIRKEFEE